MARESLLVFSSHKGLGLFGFLAKFEPSFSSCSKTNRQKNILKDEILWVFLYKNIFSGESFIRRSRDINCLINFARLLSGNCVALSDKACFGLGCVSIKTPAIPTVIAARASIGVKRRSPPEVEPSAVGYCEVCEASKMTGALVSFKIERERMSAIRLLYPKLVPRSVMIAPRNFWARVFSIA